MEFLLARSLLVRFIFSSVNDWLQNDQKLTLAENIYTTNINGFSSIFLDENEKENSAPGQKDKLSLE